MGATESIPYGEVYSLPYLVALHKVEPFPEEILKLVPWSVNFTLNKKGGLRLKRYLRKQSSKPPYDLNTLCSVTNPPYGTEVGMLPEHHAKIKKFVDDNRVIEKLAESFDRV